MRILILTQYFWPENFRINDLTSELVVRGHEVTVLTGLPNYPQGRVFEAFRRHPVQYASFHGAPVFRVPVIPRGQSKVGLILNYLSFVLMACLLGPWKLRGRPFDVIFVFLSSPVTSAFPALLLRRLKNAPVLLWILDLWPDTLEAIGVVKSARVLGWVNRMVKFIYARSDLILGQSRAFLETIAERCGGSQRVRYFPGWPEQIFAAQSAQYREPVELASYRDQFCIMFAGNIGEAQDFPAIVEAAELLRDDANLRWIIVGEGRAMPFLREQVSARNLGDRVILLGRHPMERMPEFFDHADALLVTLRDEPIWAATIPGKIQSYLSAGKPILAMLNGEGAKVLRDSGGALVGDAGDAAELAANVRRLLALSPAQRVAMARDGQRYCESQFDRGKLIDNLESWMAELRMSATKPLPRRYQSSAT